MPRGRLGNGSDLSAEMKVVCSESEDEERRSASRASGRGSALGTVGARALGQVDVARPGPHARAPPRFLRMPTHVIGPQVRAPSRAHSSWTGLRLSRPPFLRVLRFQPDASGAGRPRSADGGSLRLPPAFFTRAAARVLAVKRGLPTAAGGCPRADPLVLGMRAGRGAPRMNHAGRGRLVFVSRACEGACTCVHEGEPAVASMGAHVRARPRVRSPRRPCTPVCPRTLTPAIPACTDAGTGRGPKGWRAGRPAGEPLPAGGNRRLQPALCCEVSRKPVSSRSTAPRGCMEGLCPPLQRARGEKSGGFGQGTGGHPGCWGRGRATASAGSGWTT